MNTNRQRQAVAGIRDPGFDGSGVGRASPLLRGCAPSVYREARTTPFYLMVMTWLILAAGNAGADTHYVDINSTGPVSPYTSWETASTSIQKAVDAAAPGDTVLVNDGAYNLEEEIRIRKHLSVRSVNGRGKVIIDGKGKTRVFSISGQVELKGLRMINGFTEENGGAVVVSGKEGEISECIIENSTAGNFGGGLFMQGNGQLVENCIIRYNRSEDRGGGIHVKGGSKRTMIRGCLLLGNQTRLPGGGVWCSGNVVISRSRIMKNTAGKGGGILLNTGSKICDSLIVGNVAESGGGGGVCGELADDTGNDVINCTITQNRAPSYGGGVHKANVYNSIVYNNKASIGRDVGPSMRTVESSCARHIAEVANVTGNIDDDPKFVNVEQGDYRLLPDSPCIDSGSNTFAHSLIDLDGNPRIMDGDRNGVAIVDMGAHEFQVLNIEIDIKPGSKSEFVNLKVGGLLPVAILTTKSFDASTVNPSSVDFAGAAPARRMFQDVDEDGDLDLLLQFERRRLKLDEDSTRALLTGETKDRQLFIGEVKVKVVKE